MDSVRKRRSDATFNGNGGLVGSKRLKQEVESITTGIGSKSKPCTKFFRVGRPRSALFICEHACAVPGMDWAVQIFAAWNGSHDSMQDLLTQCLITNDESSVVH